MESSLLNTKLYIPPARQGLVTRPRLLEKLKAGLATNLVLVSAPAGSGKTTLVSGWVRQSREMTRTAWVSLDEGDNDPVRFWTYFIAALKTIKSTIGETALALLHSPQPCPIEAVLTVLINDLTDTPDDFAVVLDDYHLIKAEPIHTGIAFMLDHLPPKMHLIIATRTDPPLSLAHFRGRGTMLEIGAEDLRFTLQEAAGLLRNMQNVELASEDVIALNARTEGWAVGLTMAALSMRGQKDIGRFIATFTGSHRYVMDYLLEEVLGQQSNEIQDFLLNTSVLERLTAPVCAFVAEHSDSQAMLERLEKANLFLIPLDESRQCYRYHHLFADLLRHQLEAKLGVQGVSALHGRASQWYEDHVFADDAIHHALAARDWGRAMKLIYDPDEKRINLGETVTLLNWLKTVPEEVLRTHRQLYYQFAKILFGTGQFDGTGQFNAAEAVLGYLEQTAQDDTNLQGEIAILRAGIAENHGDYPLAVELSKRALSLLAPGNLRARSRANYLHGFIQRERGLLDEAELLLTEAYEAGLQSGDQVTACASATYLASLVWERGRLHRADELWRKAIGLAENYPIPRIMLSRFILYEWNDLEGAADHQQRVIELSTLSGQPDVGVMGYFLIAMTKLAQRDVIGAATMAEKSDQLAKMPGVARNVLARHAAYRVMFAIWQDDPVAIERWRTQLLEYADALPFSLLFIPCRVLIARGEKTAAVEQLEALYEKAAQIDNRFVLINTRIYQSMVAGTRDQALTFLAEALTLGQPEGFIRSFADEGELLAPLLRKALARGITPEYAGKLLSIIEAEGRRGRGRKGQAAPVTAANETVSERELEVLRLVAEGFSNQQIADKLNVSLSTAKTHVYHLFEKLDAKDRLQVVSRARHFKLI